MTNEASAQADVLGFLASVFSSHPTWDSVRALRALAAEIGLACPNGFSLEELDGEYMDLFVVPGPRYVAPYESVFRDQFDLPAVLRRGSNPAETGRTVKGLLMGESTLEVRRCYLQAGLLPEAELPDHLGNELRFIAYLHAREAGASPEEARALLEFGDRFRREHILKWIGELREKIVERERLGLYGAAIRVAEAILMDDEEPSDAQQRAVAVPCPHAMNQGARCPVIHHDAPG